MNVVDQSRSDRSPVQMHILAAQLIRKRPIAAHPTLLLIGRGTVRRVGVPMRHSYRRGLVFFSVDGARLDGDRLILPAG
jgi:hypothetical protein